MIVIEERCQGEGEGGNVDIGGGEYSLVKKMSTELNHEQCCNCVSHGDNLLIN